MKGPFNSRHISNADANTTVYVSTAPGAVLASISINTTSAHALTVYDANATAQIIAANIKAVIKASIAEQTLKYNAAMGNGIAITVPAGYVGDATVSFI